MLFKGFYVNITKQQILSGDAQALQHVLVTAFVAPDQMLDSAAGDIQPDQCRLMAEAVAEQRCRIDWQTQIDASWLSQLDTLLPNASLADHAYIRFCHDVLLPYPRALQLDDALLPQQEMLWQRVFLQSLHDTAFWVKPHPLKNLTDFLYLAMLGWQPGFGQHSETWLKLYQQTIEQLEQLSPGDGKGLLKLEQDTRQQFAEQQQFLDKFTQRMKIAETGKIKNRVSQLNALLFINQLTQNKVLPSVVLEFLHTTLAAELHLLLIAQGLDSRVWQQLQQLLEKLVGMYQPGANIDSSHKQLPAVLQTFIDEYLHRSDASDDFLNNIAFDLSQLSVGKPVSGMVKATPVPIPDHLQNVEKQVSQKLLNNSKQYKENQWFLLRDESNTIQRCKLLVNLEQYNQVLFCNFVGQRSLATSHDDFAYLLSARHMQPLSMYGGLTRCLHSKLDTLLDGFEQRYLQQQQQVEQLRQARIRMAEDLQRREAAEKAKAEAEAIAKRKAEAEKQAELEKLTADMKRQARLSLDSLTLGSWVEFKEADGSYKRAKLAVKFTATGRFVFVDEDGITMADTQRDELVAMMLNGGMKQLESDKKFAERLAKIVTDIRTSQ